MARVGDELVRRPARKTMGFVAVFFIGCILIVVATVVPGNVKNTSQGTAALRDWNAAVIVYVGGCVAVIDFDCEETGRITVNLAAVLQNGTLQLTERLTSDDVKFRVRSRVRCRTDRFYDEDCQGQPESRQQGGFATSYSDVRRFALFATGEQRSFLDLIYDIDVAGGGRIYGSRKYGGDVFVGTSWRWECAAETLDCTFQQ